MAVNKERALNVKSRNLSGDTETKKYNYITTDTTVTATTIKTAVQTLYTLSNNSYIDAEVEETYSLNEAAADEE